MKQPTPLFVPNVDSPVREWSAAAGVSLFAALLVASPFFFLGTASGHDIAFHMASWLDAAGQWKQGVWFPRWAEWANFGYGEPRFIFYPPLSWLFGAALGSLLPWNVVAVAFIVVTQSFAGISAYALLRRCSPGSRLAALLGCASFAANPYALMIVYARSDFAELLAIAFLPLLLLAALRLTGLSEQSAQSHLQQVAAFAAAFCLVWLSNAPAGVIATYCMALLFLAAAWLQRSPPILLRCGIGMALGFGLAGFYLLPAFYEQRWVNISGVLSGGLTPAENFLYARTADAEHDAFNRVASNVALLLIAWTVAAAISALIARRRLKAQPSNSKMLAALCVLAGAAALLMLPVTLFLWKYLPELRFVQFPWRWMAVLALCAVTFMTAAARGKWKWIWLAVVAIAGVGAARYLVAHTWWDTEDMPTLQAAILDGTGFEGTDEYDPTGDDRTDLPEKQPRARFVAGSAGGSTHPAATELFVDKWTAEHKVLRAVTREPERIALRLLDYPPWQISVNGQRVNALHASGTRQMIVPVRSGESRIEINFVRTVDRIIGGWLSLLCLAGLTGALAWQARKKPGSAV